MTNSQKHIFDAIDHFNSLRVKKKDEEWGDDNLAILEANAKKAEQRNAVIQKRFDDEVDY